MSAGPRRWRPAPAAPPAPAARRPGRARRRAPPRRRRGARSRAGWPATTRPRRAAELEALALARPGRSLGAPRRRPAGGARARSRSGRWRTWRRWWRRPRTTRWRWWRCAGWRGSPTSVAGPARRHRGGAGGAAPAPAAHRAGRLPGPGGAHRRGRRGSATASGWRRCAPRTARSPRWTLAGPFGALAALDLVRPFAPEQGHAAGRRWRGRCWRRPRPTRPLRGAGRRAARWRASRSTAPSTTWPPTSRCWRAGRYLAMVRAERPCARLARRRAAGRAARLDRGRARRSASCAVTLAPGPAPPPGQAGRAAAGRPLAGGRPGRAPTAARRACSPARARPGRCSRAAPGPSRRRPGTPAELAAALEPGGHALALAAGRARRHERRSRRPRRSPRRGWRGAAARPRCWRCAAGSTPPTARSTSRCARGRAEAGAARRALALDPGDGQARLELAELLLSAERAADADEAAGRRCPGRCAERGPALLARARVAQERGLAEAAEALAERALAAGAQLRRHPAAARPGACSATTWRARTRWSTPGRACPGGRGAAGPAPAAARRRGRGAASCWSRSSAGARPRCGWAGGWRRRGAAAGDAPGRWRSCETLRATWPRDRLAGPGARPTSRARRRPGRRPGRRASRRSGSTAPTSRRAGCWRSRTGARRSTTWRWTASAVLRAYRAAGAAGDRLGGAGARRRGGGVPPGRRLDRAGPPGHPAPRPAGGGPLRRGDAAGGRAAAAAADHQGRRPGASSRTSATPRGATRSPTSSRATSSSWSTCAPTGRRARPRRLSAAPFYLAELGERVFASSYLVQRAARLRAGGRRAPARAAGRRWWWRAAASCSGWSGATWRGCARAALAARPPELLPFVQVGVGDGGEPVAAAAGQRPGRPAPPHAGAARAGGQAAGPLRRRRHARGAGAGGLGGDPGPAPRRGRTASPRPGQRHPLARPRQPPGAGGGAARGARACTARLALVKPFDANQEPYRFGREEGWSALLLRVALPGRPGLARRRRPAGPLRCPAGAAAGSRGADPAAPGRAADPRPHPGRDRPIPEGRESEYEVRLAADGSAELGGTERFSGVFGAAAKEPSSASTRPAAAGHRDAPRRRR